MIVSERIRVKGHELFFVALACWASCDKTMLGIHRVPFCSVLFCSVLFCSVA